MTNDLHEVLNANPGSIEAFTGLAKLLLTLNPIIGGIVSVITGAVIVYLKRNTAVTKTNTASAETLKPIIEEHAAKVDAAQSNIDKKVKNFEETIDRATKELSLELDKVKIVVAKVNNAANDKLSGIPKIQDAVAKLAEGQAVTDHNVKILVKGIQERIKKP